MKPEVLKALNGSISKWRAIAAKRSVDRGSENCPLCLMFNDDLDAEPCGGCPVYEKTGEPYCGNTPYMAWWQERDTPFPIKAKTKKQADLAKAELNFLISLRPKKPRKAPR